MKPFVCVKPADKRTNLDETLVFEGDAEGDRPIPVSVLRNLSKKYSFSFVSIKESQCTKCPFDFG